MKISVIADEDTVTGFRLAGVHYSDIAEDKESFKEALSSVEDDVGIVITTERLVEKYEDLVENFKSEIDDVFPIVVEVPDKLGSVREPKIQELVKKAIGVEIDIEDI